jgi:lipoprotein-anchoring transpeptidase ErfK/SrfK
MRRRLPLALLAAFVAAAMASFVWVGSAGAQGPTSTTTTTTTAPPTTTTTTTPPPPPAPEPPPAPPAPPPPPALTPEQLEFLYFIHHGPRVPAGSGSGRRIVYSVTGQRVWIVEADETVTKTYLVSGRANTPGRGFYRVYSRSVYASSGSARMRHMVRFARGSSMAIGFHSIPTSGGRPLQSEAQLGTYRSHGCVRQRNSDAEFLYNWAPVGTLVAVVK